MGVTRTPFGDRLMAARKRRGWSQLRAAEACGIGETSLKQYESRGEHPSYIVLDLLSRGLGVPPCELMGLPCDTDAGRVRAHIGAIRYQLDEMERAVPGSG